MGAAGLQLVCNSGPPCTADLSRDFFFFCLSTSKQGSFPIFLTFSPVSAVLLPSCRLLLFFPLS